MSTRIDAVMDRAGRMATVRQNLALYRLDALLLTSRENNRYLSGFSGSESFLAITPARLALFVDFRYLEQAALECPGVEIVDYTLDRMEALNIFFRDNVCRRIGVEEEQLSWKMSSQLTTGAGGAESPELVAAEGWVLAIRSVKDAGEADIMIQAAQIAEKAFLEILPTIKPGQRENEIAARLEHAMRNYGASGPSFATIVASGPRSAMPHGVASDRRVGAGEAIVMDFGCIRDGYCSDMTRTVFLGEPPRLARSVYSIVQEAQAKAQDAVRAGLPGCDIDRIARDIIDQAGYGQYFGHGLGHGVGLAIHELPRLSRMAREELKGGQVVTVEPGIYLPGQFGIRIEDTVIVESAGSHDLNRVSKDLVVLPV
jgi:Xaa-Pro aminopeptidase